MQRKAGQCLKRSRFVKGYGFPAASCEPRCARNRWYQHPRWGHFYADVNQAPPNIARRTKSAPNERRVPTLPAIKNDITARDTCLPGCETQSYSSLLPPFTPRALSPATRKWRFVSTSFGPASYIPARLYPRSSWFYGVRARDLNHRASEISRLGKCGRITLSINFFVVLISFLNEKEKLRGGGRYGWTRACGGI